jgi:hypothetical protein
VFDNSSQVRTKGGDRDKKKPESLQSLGTFVFGSGQTHRQGIWKASGGCERSGEQRFFMSTIGAAGFDKR